MQVFRCLITLAPLLLAACAGDGQAPKTLTLSNDGALMIVGVAIDHYDTSFGVTNWNSVAGLDLGWIRWEGGKPVPTTFSSSDKMVLSLQSCGVELIETLSSSKSRECDLRKMQYYVVQAAPGTYGFGGITRTMGNFRDTTEIKSRDQTMTRIGAGEIIYIGDLTIDALEEPMKIVRYGRNDEGARQALSSYPNIHGDVVYKKPTANPQ